jgi:HNH endonuclease
MRPVNRGLRPAQIFTNYRDAFPLLMARIGDYCCYCERHIPTNLAIEHVQEKVSNPDLLTEWENFLLACVNCNSCKGDTIIDLDSYLWPHLNNTLLAFTYEQGEVRVTIPQDEPAYARAAATITLLGLDKQPGRNGREPTPADLRWKFRYERLEAAKFAKTRLARRDSPEMREQIVETAKGGGGFSIWFSVFRDDPDMCQRLIAAFPGTALDCFQDGIPVPKPGATI